MGEQPGVANEQGLVAEESGVANESGVVAEELGWRMSQGSLQRSWDPCRKTLLVPVRFAHP